ncbi:MAG: serine protease [Pseudomonadota bacterium]
MNPLNGVALLYKREANVPLAFLGTCFSLRHATHFLTAAHCVHELTPDQLVVVSHLDQRTRLVTNVTRHPHADIAILNVDPVADDGVESFWNSVGNFSLGEEYFAFGFPEDALGPNEGRPTPRLFKGYFHRFMPHQSHMGYRYIAGELSTPCPGGLSGAPLFRPGAPVMLTGIVAENLESSTLLDTQERVLTDGQIFNEHYRSVVNFGIAVMLEPIKDWLDQHVPPRAHA